MYECVCVLTPPENCPPQILCVVVRQHWVCFVRVTDLFLVLQGKYTEVIADCSAALRIDPDYSKCLLRRAQAYETEKKVYVLVPSFRFVCKSSFSMTCEKPTVHVCECVN